jgi:hypothetical protein
MRTPPAQTLTSIVGTATIIGANLLPRAAHMAPGSATEVSTATSLLLHLQS